MDILFNEKREQSWKSFWLSWPYAFGKKETKEVFEAGYDSATAAAIRATCYMCANSTHYSPAGRIEGSQMLWHYYLPDGWLHGQCLAEPIWKLANTENTPRLCAKCGHAGMLTKDWICTYDCTPNN